MLSSIRHRAKNTLPVFNPKTLDTHKIKSQSSSPAPPAVVQPLRGKEQPLGASTLEPAY